ncbi:MAG: hypothetical protein KAJ98_12375 [Spirochaetaceae bacterium]|nr:hypothetical protein [Spirochaetaceae bacterium]
MSNSNKIFRYRNSHKWFKGKTHIHSTASDGDKTIPEIANFYAEADYDFIFITDHDVCSDVAKSCPDSPLLLIDGVELGGKDKQGSYYHIICLGRVHGIPEKHQLEERMNQACEQGAVLVLAHPRWCGTSMEEANRYGFAGVEIYNHVCHWLSGKSDGLTYWDEMLAKDPTTLCFAADDAHFKPEHPGYNGGWIAINAPELTEGNVLAAIKSGNFYSSCGPEFKAISLAGSTLHIETSPVQFIRLVGPGRKGWRTGSFDGELKTQISIEAPDNWEYMYLEIEDQNGKRAWSNTLFI